MTGPIENTGALDHCQEELPPVRLILGADGGEMMRLSMECGPDECHYMIPLKEECDRIGFSVRMTNLTPNLFPPHYLDLNRPPGRPRVLWGHYFKGPPWHYFPGDDDWDMLVYQSTKIVNGHATLSALIVRPPARFDLSGSVQRENLSITMDDYTSLKIYTFSASFEHTKDGWRIFNSMYCGERT